MFSLVPRIEDYAQRGVRFVNDRLMNLGVKFTYVRVGCGTRRYLRRDPLVSPTRERDRLSLYINLLIDLPEFTQSMKKFLLYNYELNSCPCK